MGGASPPCPAPGGSAGTRKTGSPGGLGRLQVGGQTGRTGCHWGRLALQWASGSGSTGRTSCPAARGVYSTFPCVLPDVLWGACHPLCQAGWGLKPSEGSGEEGAAGPSGALPSAPMFVPLQVSVARTALPQSIPACTPLVRVTAPVLLSPLPSPPFRQPRGGGLFIRCRLRALNYSGQRFPESEKTRTRGRSAARCLPSFPHLCLSASALICTDAACEAVSSVVVPVLSGGIRTWGLHLSRQLGFDCGLLILLAKN